MARGGSYSQHTRASDANKAGRMPFAQSAGSKRYYLCSLRVRLDRARIGSLLPFVRLLTFCMRFRALEAGRLSDQSGTREVQ